MSSLVTNLRKVWMCCLKKEFSAVCDPSLSRLRVALRRSSQDHQNKTPTRTAPHPDVLFFSGRALAGPRHMGSYVVHCIPRGIIHLDQGSANFSVINQRVNKLTFVSQLVSSTTSQFSIFMKNTRIKKEVIRQDCASIYQILFWVRCGLWSHSL